MDHITAEQLAKCKQVFEYICICIGNDYGFELDNDMVSAYSKVLKTTDWKIEPLFDFAELYRLQHLDKKFLQLDEFYRFFDNFHCLRENELACQNLLNIYNEHSHSHWKLSDDHPWIPDSYANLYEFINEVLGSPKNFSDLGKHIISYTAKYGAASVIADCFLSYKSKDTKKTERADESICKDLLDIYNIAKESAWVLDDNIYDVIHTAYIKSYDSFDLADYIKNYVKCTRATSSLYECFSSYNPSRGLPKPEESPDYPKDTKPDRKVKKTMARKQTTSKTTTSDKVADSMSILEQALMEVIKKQSIPIIEKDIKDCCVSMVQDFIAKEYGTIERKIITVINGEEHTTTGVLHEQFDTVLKFVENDEPVFLTGPAGSGKNYICQQIAEALGLNFYFSNAVTQEYKLTGFTDAMGNYQPTQFYKAFTEGGLFMLDEIDASIPEVLVILNAAIANRYFDFPAPIGYRKAHPDFRVVAAGNTTGNGADYTYVGRNQLDGASLDRFAVVKVDYSKSIEDSMAGNRELADFCREFRKAADKTGIQVITSYRAINRLAKMTQIMHLTDALDTCLIKGLAKDDISIICKELSNSKYKSALLELATRK